MIDPLPSLVFTRDASTWIGDQAVVASLPGPRHRESALMAVIYDHHPRFGGLRSRYDAGRKHLDGGDLLATGTGRGSGRRGSADLACAAERLAKHLFEAGGGAHGASGADEPAR